jgi:ribonuclease BN (tRNA processing enzyme)
VSAQELALFQVTPLGTSTPYPRPNRPCSGYLLRSSMTAIWVDAGGGTLANLQRYTHLESLDAIWISHLHADHCSDLLLAYYALRFSELRPARRIPVFGPPQWWRRFETFLESTRLNRMEEAFELEELSDGRVDQIGSIEIACRSVAHGVPAFGLRARVGQASLVYSGDSGPCASLTDLARQAGVFLCEVGWSARPVGESAWHMTPEDAGNTANAAGVGRLLLTHISPDLERDAARARAHATFGRSVDLAEEGVSVTL